MCVYFPIKRKKLNNTFMESVQLLITIAMCIFQLPSNSTTTLAITTSLINDVNEISKRGKS